MPGKQNVILLYFKSGLCRTLHLHTKTFLQVVEGPSQVTSSSSFLILAANCADKCCTLGSFRRALLGQTTTSSHTICRSNYRQWFSKLLGPSAFLKSIMSMSSASISRTQLASSFFFMLSRTIVNSISSLLLQEILYQHLLNFRTRCLISP